ncbi:hypothetical protein V8C26DRAFT_120190 [Trichoderma gracile]
MRALRVVRAGTGTSSCTSSDASWHWIQVILDLGKQKSRRTRISSNPWQCCAVPCCGCCLWLRLEISVGGWSSVCPSIPPFPLPSHGRAVFSNSRQLRLSLSVPLETPKLAAPITAPITATINGTIIIISILLLLAAAATTPQQPTSPAKRRHPAYDKSLPGRQHDQGFIRQPSLRAVGRVPRADTQSSTAALFGPSYQGMATSVNVVALELSLLHPVQSERPWARLPSDPPPRRDF